MGYPQKRPANLRSAKPSRATRIHLARVILGIKERDKLCAYLLILRGGFLSRARHQTIDGVFVDHVSGPGTCSDPTDKDDQHLVLADPFRLEGMQ